MNDIEETGFIEDLGKNDDSEILDTLKDSGENKDYEAMSIDIEDSLMNHNISSIIMQEENVIDDNAILIDLSDMKVFTMSLMEAIKSVIVFCQQTDENDTEDIDMSIYLKTNGIRFIGKCKKFNTINYGVDILREIIRKDVIYTRFNGKEFKKYKNSISKIKLTLR